EMTSGSSENTARPMRLGSRKGEAVSRPPWPRMGFSLLRFGLTAFHSPYQNGEGRPPPRNSGLSQADLRLALGLRLVERLLHGDGAGRGGFELLADDVAHEGVVLDDGRDHQVVKALENGLAVLRRGEVEVAREHGLVVDGGQVPAGLDAD